MKPTNIILVRHGQSEGNVDKTIYSRKPDYTLNLTPAGIQQALDAGKEIAKICDEPTAFYVSPFFRTRQTAECIQQSFTGNIWKSYEDVRLREQEWGGHISQGFNEDHETQRDEHGTFYWRFPNGESCADVFDRVSDFMNTLHRDFEKKDFPDNVVIVTHGMAMRVFLMRWAHLTVEQFELLANPSNCGIYHLKLGDGSKYNLVTPAKMYDAPYNKHKYKSVVQLQALIPQKAPVKAILVYQATYRDGGTKTYTVSNAAEFGHPIIYEDHRIGTMTKGRFFTGRPGSPNVIEIPKDQIEITQ